MIQKYTVLVHPNAANCETLEIVHPPDISLESIYGTPKTLQVWRCLAAYCDKMPAKEPGNKKSRVAIILRGVGDTIFLKIMTVRGEGLES